jgi:hypothetical protein
LEKDTVVVVVVAVAVAVAADIKMGRENYE